jgi:DNA polymerase delta subunit 2
MRILKSPGDGDFQQKKYGYDSSTFSDAPTKAFDAFLSSLLLSVDVDLLPGEKDPSIPTLPQQPLHRALLPESAKSDGLRCTTNPSWMSVGGATCVVSF